MNNQFSYRIVVMEGLNGANFSNSGGIRSGRQKGHKANAADLLYNMKVEYTGYPGLRAGVSYSYNNATVDENTNNAINLMEFHAKYEKNNI